MDNFEIVNAKFEDLPIIKTIYERAKQFMVESGNPNQWNGSYPTIELLENDIRNNHLYVIKSNGKIYGVFALILGDDPTYSNIDGEWISDKPYGTIHRVASSGEVKGVFDIAIRYSLSVISHLRIDTHKDNAIMQKLILKNGFKKCGIIRLLSGDPRIAFEKV